MAKLTTTERKHLSHSDFALPPNRFPIENESHARNALARAAQGLKAHTLTPAEAAEIRSKVHAKYPDIKMGAGK